MAKISLLQAMVRVQFPVCLSVFCLIETYFAEKPAPPLPKRQTSTPATMATPSRVLQTQGSASSINPLPASTSSSLSTPSNTLASSPVIYQSNEQPLPAGVQFDSTLHTQFRVTSPNNLFGLAETAVAARSLEFIAAAVQYLA
jgi:hypothetical protein